MGSSKSGSLDKFASFSPAAALASGKVKLPETSLIGMMQADAEDNKVMKENNLANQMAYQNQQDEQQKYMQMMQQQMVPGMNMGGQVDSMKFLKQHLPYQDGGHVALRRKMFKMGGDVNTHGVGITSGLEYRGSMNQGGPVVQPGPDGQLRQHAAIGGGIKAIIAAAKAGKGKRVKSLLDYIKGRPDVVKSTKRVTGKGGKPYDLIDETGFSKMARLGQAGRAADVVGSAALPLGLASLPFDRMSAEERETATDFAKGFDTARGVAEFLPTLSGPGAIFEGVGTLADTLYESTQEDPDYGIRTPIELIRKYTGISEGPPAEPEMPEGSGENIGVDPDAFMKAANQAQEDAMEERIQKYVSYLSGEEEEPDTLLGKFFAAEGLGDALVAGGSELMQSGDYGAAAQAFNEPLSAARRGETAEEAATRAAAANLVISEDMQIDAENRALANELLATGDIDTAQQTELYKLAQSAGVRQLVPTVDDGTEIDVDKLLSRAGVYADPKGLNPQGTLLVAVNSEGGVEYTNNPQAAKEYAAS
jgi:hypothetical protein